MDIHASEVVRTDIDLTGLRGHADDLEDLGIGTHHLHGIDNRVSGIGLYRQHQQLRRAIVRLSLQRVLEGLEHGRIRIALGHSHLLV